MERSPRYLVRLMALLLMLVAAPASASLLVYSSLLSGAAESPPNGSLGTGSGMVTIDTAAHTMLIDVTFSGLLSPVTAAHIHCCTSTAGSGTAIVATQTPSFLGFPAGVTSGTYSHTFDLLDATSWNAAFVTAFGNVSDAEAALLLGLSEGKAYLNIHTSQFPGGEIRGFLASNQVPEPRTLWLAGLALLVLALAQRRTG